MSLFELFGERRNPGPIGDLDVGPPDEDRGGDGLGVRSLITAVLLGFWLLFVFNATTSLETRAAVIVFSVAYLLAAYFLHPKPDYSNVGFLGGMIDHPFRYSDDLNRMLLALLVVLWPGRIVTTTCVDLWRRLV